MRILLPFAVFALPLLAACQERYDHVSHPIPYSVGYGDYDNDPDKAKAVAPPFMDPAIQSPLSFVVTANDGKPYALSQHLGQVVMIVNTASKCGLTPQYAGLEATYLKYKDQGFTIVAFPANNFNEQEPGDDAKIRLFCSNKYNVTFPLMGKVSVGGDDICPLYQFLTSENPYPEARDAKLAKKGPIEWNFAKFLVDRNGRVVARFKPQVDPRDPVVVAEIEKYLKESAKEAAKKEAKDEAEKEVKEKAKEETKEKTK